MVLVLGDIEKQHTDDAKGGLNHIAIAEVSACLKPSKTDAVIVG